MSEVHEVRFSLEIVLFLIKKRQNDILRRFVL